MAFREVPGIRRGATLFTGDDGYYYQYINVTDKKTFYKCHMKRCNARVTVVERDIIVDDRFPGHCHGPDLLLEQVHLLRDKIFERAEKEATPLKKLFDEECNKVPHDVAQQLSFYKMESSLQKCRRKNFPPLPESAIEFDLMLNSEQWSERFSRTLDGKTFYRGNVLEAGNNNLVFLSENAKQILSSSEELHIDGTFKSVPGIRGLKQLLVVTAISFDHAFPVAYALMERKTYGSYVKVLQKVKEVVPEAKPKFVMSDYESGLMRALDDTFRDSEISGCWWHYCNSGHKDSKSWIRRETSGIGEPLSTISHDWKSADDPDHSKKTEDVLFEMFKDEEKDIIHVGKFLAALRNTGLRKNDPRLADFMENLKNVHRKSGMEGGSPETQKLDLDTFRQVISGNLVLISKAFRHNFIIPDFQNFCKYIEEFYWKCKSNTEGKVASYIPQLARMNPDYWGVSVCTIDGQRFSIGDVTVPFTLQSCSKPLTYGIALEQLGQEVVHSFVGQEPSGRNFNELVLDFNKKPHNPMINAGAILICSLLKTLVKSEMTLAEKFDYTMNYFKRLAGGEYLGFNNSVFLSERESADRNYALGFYMRENKCYPEKTNLKECMDFYFQCCAMEANCESMSVMAATLANGGICPITEEKVLKPDSIRDVLSLMHSCGMYDYSGQFAFKVGLPAKSGVCGGMLVVIPNTMGICSWSPPLDHMGNSCRGVQFCEELVRVFNFHRYDNMKHATNKLDPRRHKYETKGLSIVNLLFSAASGDLSAMRRHRLSGMDMTLADYDGRTALHLAAAEGHLDIVTFLLEQCNVPHHPKDRWGNSPLDEAMRFRHVQVVNYLKAWAKLQPPPGLDDEPSSCDADKKRPVEETSPLPS